MSRTLARAFLAVIDAEGFYSIFMAWAVLDLLPHELSMARFFVHAAAVVATYKTIASVREKWKSLRVRENYRILR
jgi:hypothetical protein